MILENVLLIGGIERELKSKRLVDGRILHVRTRSVARKLIGTYSELEAVRWTLTGNE